VSFWSDGPRFAAGVDIAGSQMKVSALKPVCLLVVLAPFWLASGCSIFASDPLDDVTLLSDVALAPNAEPAALVAPAEQPRLFGGLLSVFTRDAPAADQTPDLVVANVAEVGAAATVAAENTAPRRGVLGFVSGLIPTRRAPQAPEVAQVFVPPVFGEIIKNCAVSNGDLGTKIASASGYTIYDSQPGTVQVRPHYITGFNDRCPRRFDAALVLLGDIGTHEIVRYSKTRVDLDYSATDNAYEAIKASYCGVGRDTPCGSRIDRLARDTTFVTAYETFGAGPTWAEFLLHDGDVAAAGIEG